MDRATIRPFSIHDQVDDPALDPAPIRHAMPPPDRLQAGYGTLTAVGLGWALLALAPHPFGDPSKAPPVAASAPARDLDFSLAEPPPAVPGGGGAGGSSPEPGLGLARPAPHPLPASSFDDLAPVRSDRPDLALPQPATGDGRPAASGIGNGQGLGPGTGKAARHDRRDPGTAGPATPAFDFNLVPLACPRVRYQLKPGESGKDAKVLVRITVEDDGRVSQVHPVSGPAFLYPAVIETARAWVFEPLRAHGLKGPLEVKINFTCEWA